MLKTGNAWRRQSFITTVFVAAMDRENSPYDQRSSEACRPRVDKVMWHPEFWRVWKDAKSSS
jgi:hypothetical protein